MKCKKWKQTNFHFNKGENSMNIVFQGTIGSIAEQLLMLIAKYGSTTKVMEVICGKEND